MFGFLKFLKRYFFGLYVSVGTYIKRFFTPADFTIYGIKILFNVKHLPKEDTFPTLWNHWEPENHKSPYVSHFRHPSNMVDSLKDVLDTAPDFVDDVRIEITYWYRNELKKYQTTKAN